MRHMAIVVTHADVGAPQLILKRDVAYTSYQLMFIWVENKQIWEINELAILLPNLQKKAGLEKDISILHSILYSKPI